MIFRITIAFAFLCLAACAPLQTVKPLPDFVSTGLAVGDRVTVTTHDGEVREFIVTGIRADALVGESEEFLLKDLASIKKHAWKRPASPCGGEKPLGCSLPILVSLASELHNHYEQKFYDACAQHDYCYRHGAASYGLDRKACDEEFLENMQESCPDAATGKLGKIFEVVDDSLDSRRQCMSAASDYYAAVRRYGEKRFETTGSTYCEYNGPPPVATAGQPEAGESP